MRNLPIAIDNPLASIPESKSSKAAMACHQWQYGTHIESLPKEPPQDYSPEVGEVTLYRA